ncbi:MAG TPA: hypothetical protein ENK43_10040 [Planctomycetes bacterium]|nr:hypothetical protein [Planctomycetota bacterium]
MNESERFEGGYMDDRSALALGLHILEEESLLRAFVSFLTAEGFDEDLQALALGERDVEDVATGWRRHFGFVLSGLAVASLLLSIHIIGGRGAPERQSSARATPAALISVQPQDQGPGLLWPSL